MNLMILFTCLFAMSCHPNDSSSKRQRPSSSGEENPGFNTTYDQTVEGTNELGIEVEIPGTKLKIEANSVDSSIKILRARLMRVDDPEDQAVILAEGKQVIAISVVDAATGASVLDSQITKDFVVTTQVTRSNSSDKLDLLMLSSDNRFTYVEESDLETVTQSSELKLSEIGSLVKKFLVPKHAQPEVKFWFSNASQNTRFIQVVPVNRESPRPSVAENPITDFKWSSPTIWSLSGPVLSIAVAIGSNANNVSIQYTYNAAPSNDNLIKRTFNGVVWSNPPLQVDNVSENSEIMSHAVVRRSDNVEITVYENSRVCLNSMMTTPSNATNSICGIVAGPASKVLVHSGLTTVGASSSQGLFYFDGASWSSNIVFASPVGGAVAFDSQGSLIALSGTGLGSIGFHRRNADSWDQNYTLINGGTEIRQSLLYASKNGAVGTFHSTLENGANGVKAIRRTSSGIWQNAEVLASVSGGDGYNLRAGVDANGKMVAAWSDEVDELEAKIFDGTSWGSIRAIDSDGSPLSFEVCSHPESETMFIVWPTYEIIENSL